MLRPRLSAERNDPRMIYEVSPAIGQTPGHRLQNLLDGRTGLPSHFSTTFAASKRRASAHGLPRPFVQRILALSLKPPFTGTLSIGLRLSAAICDSVDIG